MNLCSAPDYLCSAGHCVLGFPRHGSSKLLWPELPGPGKLLGRKISWSRKWNPLQYSCLENPRDRGARWATVHWVTKSQTQLKRLSTHIMQGKGRSGWCGSTELQRGRNTAEPRSCPPHSAFACAGLCPLLSGEGDPITLSWVNICLPRFFALSSPLSLFSGLDLV